MASKVIYNARSQPKSLKDVHYFPGSNTLKLSISKMFSMLKETDSFMQSSNTFQLKSYFCKVTLILGKNMLS